MQKIDLIISEMLPGEPEVYICQTVDMGKVHACLISEQCGLKKIKVEIKTRLNALVEEFKRECQEQPLTDEFKVIWDTRIQFKLKLPKNKAKEEELSQLIKSKNGFKGNLIFVEEATKASHNFKPEFRSFSEKFYEISSNRILGRNFEIDVHSNFSTTVARAKENVAILNNLIKGWKEINAFSQELLVLEDKIKERNRVNNIIIPVKKLTKKHKNNFKCEKCGKFIFSKLGFDAHVSRNTCGFYAGRVLN